MSELYFPVSHDGPHSRRILEFANRCAGSGVPVLIWGRTGTGKGVLAKLIHRLSTRRDGPFVVAPAPEIAGSLAESYFFGHERGAFTGAVERQVGCVEASRGGTLFVDELDDLDTSIQAKLLRTIEERVVRRVGGNENVRVDFRLITASKQDPERLVDMGKLREDFFYRIRTATIRMPSLAERVGELRPLFDQFLAAACLAERQAAPVVEDGFYAALRKHSWPGNLRELRSLAERVVMDRLPRLRGADFSRYPVSVKLGGRVREGTIESAKSAAVSAALATNRSLAGAARVLGVSRPTLYSLIAKYGLRPVRSESLRQS